MRMPDPDARTIARKSEIVAALQAIVPGEGVIYDPEALAAYESDGLTAYRQPPLITVLPETVEQVSAVLRYCHEEKIKVGDEDLSRFVYFESMRRREKPEKMVRELRKNPDEVDSIRQGLLFDKVLDFLLEKATITETAS